MAGDCYVEWLPPYPGGTIDNCIATFDLRGRLVSTGVGRLRESEPRM